MKLLNKKILVIAPHPDDEVICCGGLIAKAKAEKADVFVLYIAVGESRQLVTGHTERKTRMEEIKEVAKFGNFKYKIQFIGEQFMRLDSLHQKELIEPIEDIIEEFKPDIVCIPFGRSFDQDHRATFSACITALRPRPKSVRHLPNIVLEYEEPYAWSVGESFKPNFFINIEKFLDDKMKLLRLHKSQLREEPFSRSEKNLTRLAELRGHDIGMKSVEAFISHRCVVE